MLFTERSMESTSDILDECHRPGFSREASNGNKTNASSAGCNPKSAEDEDEKDSSLPLAPSQFSFPHDFRVQIRP